MRKRTVKTGLRLLLAAIILVLTGTFFSQYVSSFFFLSARNSVEFVQLSLFWGGILGAAAIITISAGLIRSSIYNDATRLMPTSLLVVALLILFMVLFYRSLSAPPATPPIRPGETVVI